MMHWRNWKVIPFGFIRLELFQGARGIGEEERGRSPPQNWMLYWIHVPNILLTLNTLYVHISSHCITLHHMKHETWNVKCETWNIKCEVWNMKHETWSMKHEARNMKRKVWNVKHQMWSMKHAAWNMKYETWSTKLKARQMKRDSWRMPSITTQSSGVVCLSVCVSVCLCMWV